MAKEKRFKVCFLFFKICIYIISFGIFLHQVGRILHDRLTGLSTIGSSTKKHDKLHLPSVTFCPALAFKKEGPFFGEEEFNTNAFNLTDIFIAKTLDKIKNERKFQVREVRNILQGRCYTITILGNNQFVFYYDTIIS